MGISVRRMGLAWIAGLLLVVVLPAWASSSPLETLRAQFTAPDNRVDYAAAKIAVDRLIDPSTDEAAIRSQLDRWERAIRANAPAGASGRPMLDALFKTLYKPGPWNDGKPFSYDLDDPLGKKPVNKLLATYLRTRKGNCVSMPILVAILGQRLGLTITLTTAPEHVLAKFADDSIQAWVNVEGTTGGYQYDEAYIQEMEISQKALDNEIYLRPLYPHEAVGVMASTLMEHYARHKNANALMEIADLALAANPKDTVAMIWKANAYYLQVEQRYRARYSEASDIPLADQPDYLRLSRENLAWFTKAERLGWKPPTAERDKKYLQSIQREKAKRGQ